ncbi:MAG: hypothetical protein ACM3KM_00190 [Acidobacteriaceae bacterium]
MSDKKKYIYIAIIVVCVGVMIWAFTTMNSSTPNPAAESPLANNALTADSAASASTSPAQKKDYTLKEYSAPKVFPESKKYNSDVLGQQQLKDLIDYQPITSVPPEELNKENLFAPYNQ